MSTVGIEIETDLISVSGAEKLLQDEGLYPYFKATRDASCETPAFTTRNGKATLTRTSSRTMKNTMGSEFVSVPMNMEDLRKGVRLLTGVLQTRGEPSFSKRSSIHIHIGCKPSLRLVTNALKLFTVVEPLFYRLAGMGYEFRGTSNNAIYCRPITNPYGPPVVSSEDGNWYQLFTPSDLLKSQSMEEFWYKFAVNPERPERYHPARYFGLNLFSLILHGTLEFRYFNKTMNHQKILALASLCQCVTELLNHPMELPPVKFVEDDDMGRLQFLHGLLKNQNKENFLSDRDMLILESLVTTSKHVVFEEKYVRSHLIDKYSLAYSYLKNYVRKQVPPAECIHSGFVDVHNINSKKFDFLENII